METTEPRPRWEKLLSKMMPRHFQEQLIKNIEKLHKLRRDDPESAKEVAEELTWMIPAMAVEGFTLALFVADILIFAVIVHSTLTAGILLGVAVGMIGLAVNLGYYYPYPSSFSEVLIGALIAMSLFAATVVVGFSHAKDAVPASLLLFYVIAGVVALTLTGFAFYFPKWNPEKYTESVCAYNWAFALNCAWAVCWWEVMKVGWTVGGAVPLDFLFLLAPIFVLTGMFYQRASQDGIKIKKKDDPDGTSLDPLKRMRHDIKRKRVVLYTFRGGLGEAVVFAALIGNLLTQVFLRPHWDSQQFGANVVATIMLFAVWRYIRRANRRAEALLEADLQALKAGELIVKDAARWGSPVRQEDRQPR